MTEYKNPLGKTPDDLMTGRIMKAVNEGSLEKLKDAIRDQADLEMTRADQTPLMVAISKKLTDISLELIDAGANVYAKNRLGFSVLQYAVKNHENAVVNNLVVQQKVRIDSKDKNGHTAIVTAIESQNVEALSLLINHNANLDIKVENQSLLNFFKDKFAFEENQDNPGLYELYKKIKASIKKEIVVEAANPAISANGAEEVTEVAPEFRGRLSSIKKKNS